MTGDPSTREPVPTTSAGIPDSFEALRTAQPFDPGLYCRWKGALSAGDSPSSIERKKRHMSRLTVVVGHSGMYAMSLAGERTETELREKMVSSSSLAFVAWL